MVLEPGKLVFCKVWGEVNTNSDAANMVIAWAGVWAYCGRGMSGSVHRCMLAVAFRTTIKSTRTPWEGAVVVVVADFHQRSQKR